MTGNPGVHGGFLRAGRIIATKGLKAAAAWVRFLDRHAFPTWESAT
jgi:hypothetical protein